MVQHSASASREMTLTREGPNALTEFTNDKFGQIMWLHMVSPGNKMVEVNSEHDDALSSGTIVYNGPTVKYELNTTYHVTMSDDADQQILKDESQ